MDSISRKDKVLDIITRVHIESAEPICSKYIADIIGVSSATIRNIMSELEDDGYLEQPHTSAGRVPTERAYRRYVNSLIEERASVLRQIERLKQDLFSRYQKYSEIIEKVSYSVSKLTHYTSFVIYPRDHIYMDGAFHMLEQPEFCSLPKIKKILKTLDEKEKLLDTINSYLSGGVLNIHIGRENQIEGFESCSVITSSYKVKGKVVGGIGIIGPIRMNYKVVVPIVKYLSDSVSSMLERYYE